MYLMAAGWYLFVRHKSLEHWGVNGVGDSSDQPLTAEQRSLVGYQASWVNAAAVRPLPWARCLQRSLALYFWMDRHHLDPRIKIGVRKQGTTLVAHAWVECGGEVINDSPQALGQFRLLRRADQTLTGVTWPELPGKKGGARYE